MWCFLRAPYLFFSFEGEHLRGQPINKAKNNNSFAGFELSWPALSTSPLGISPEMHVAKIQLLFFPLCPSAETSKQKTRKIIDPISTRQWCGIYRKYVCIYRCVHVYAYTTILDTFTGYYFGTINKTLIVWNCAETGKSVKTTEIPIVKLFQYLW